MLNKLKKIQATKQSDEGFTIIEVMIVLAIAGLIILIVFLAVPALQRNSRNTAIKSDVSNVGGGITTYESNNNGVIPTSVSGTGDIVIKTATGSSETTKVQGGTLVKTVAAVPASVAIGEVDVFVGNTCPIGLGGTGQASTRAFSMFYSIETSSGSILKCTDS
jgi:prepilin-type N-terminal cleavage/methylation domain-containing protein